MPRDDRPLYAVLIDADGRLRRAAFDRLLDRRDDRPIYIAE